MTLQPALAATYQYNVYVKGLSPNVHQPGVGIGDLNTGQDPTATDPAAPNLKLSASSLAFALQQGDAPQTQSTLLTNVGTAEAQLSGIVSDQNFNVTSNCPLTLAPAASCSISVTFQQTGQGSVSYPMPIDAVGAKSPVVLALSEIVPTVTGPKAQLAAYQSVVDMGKVNPGETVTGASTIVNVGNLPAQLSGIASGNGFGITSDCPATLAPQAFCTISARFSSFVPGPTSTTLQLVGNPGDNPLPLTFYATVLKNDALAPVLAFDQTLLKFGPLAAGASEVKSLTLTNTGTVPATLSAIPKSPDFDIGSDCTSTLDVNQSCHFSVLYLAKADTPNAGFHLQMTAKEGSVAQAQLQGTVSGATGGSSSTPGPSLVFAPDSLPFDPVNIGETKTQKATLTNQGTAAAKITSLVLRNGTGFSQQNDCSSSLAPGASCNISVTFKPVTTSTTTGSVEATLDTGSKTSLPIAGTGIAAFLSVSPQTINLGALRLADVQTARVSVSNPGNITLTGLRIVSNDTQATVGSNTCGTSLNSRQSCNFSVTYKPAALGDIGGTLSVYSTNGGASTIQLKGSVVQVVLTPDALTFESTPVGRTATTQTLTLSNMGPSALPLDGISVASGMTDYNQSNNCGNSLGAGASCSIAIAYTPTLDGVRGGSLVVVSLGTVVAQASFTGTATATNLVVSPGVVQFPDTVVQKTSPVMSIVVKNPTADTVTLSGMGVVLGADVFGSTNNCGTQLESGATCVVNLVATPLQGGLVNGTWGFDSSLGQKTVGLSVTGLVPKGSIDTPGSGSGTGTGGTTPGDGYVHYALTFLDTEVGASSAVRNITLSNSGTGPLSVQGISAVTGLADFAQSNNCGTSIPVGKSCTISIVFTPSATGVRTGAVVVDSDGGKFYLDLSGKGIAAVGAWTGVSDFGMAPVGTTVQRTFTLRNNGAIPAKNVFAELSGRDLALTSNGCGTTDAPIVLQPNTGCSVGVSYSPVSAGSTNGMLKASGTFMAAPVTMALTGTSPVPGLSIDTTTSGDYGTYSIGATQARTYVLRNVGQFADTLSATPTVSGDAFSRTGGTCAKGLSMAANSTCTIIVSATPTALGPQQGIISAVSTKGAGASLNLAVSGTQSSYKLSGAAGSDTTPATDFGLTTTGAGVPVSRDFYLRDSSDLATIVASQITIKGSPSFAITGVDVRTNAGAGAGTCAYNSSGTTAPCATGGPGRVIRVNVTFSKPLDGANTATLHFDHNGTEGSAELTLTGTGAFDATGQLSGTYGSATAIDGAMGTASQSPTGATTLTKTFFVRNVGTRGALALNAALSGDANFKLTKVAVVDNTGYYPGAAYTASINASGTQSSQLSAYDPTVNSWRHIAVTVTFSATAEGTYNGVLTIPHTGINTPNPIVVPLSASTVYNAAAQVSATPGSTTTVVGSMGNATFNPSGTSNTITKTIFVRNVGQNGALGVTVNLSGDPSFKLTQVGVADGNGTVPSNSYNATITNGTTSSRVFTGDPATGSVYKNVLVTVSFKPPALGTFNSTLVLSHTGINSPNPIEVPLTGNGVYDAAAQVSASAGGSTAYSGGFGSVSSTGSVSKTFYVRNIGTYGSLGLTAQITGDAAFKLAVVSLTDNTGYLPGNAYKAGIDSTGTSSSLIYGGDPSINGNYRNFAVTVTFRPGAVGTFNGTLTLNHTGVNTPNPVSIPLSGTGT